MAAGVALIGVFGPWLLSGASRRSSFELLDLVDRLGFANDGVFAWVVRFWPVVPLMIVVSVVAAWADRPRASALVGVFSGLYVAGVSIGVNQAPDADLVRTTWGVQVAALGGLGLLAAAIWSLVVSRPRLRVRPSPF